MSALTYQEEKAKCNEVLLTWFIFTTIPQKRGPGRIGGYCWYGGYCCSGAAKTGGTSSAEIVSVSVEKRPEEKTNRVPKKFRVDMQRKPKGMHEIQIEWTYQSRFLNRIDFCRHGWAFVLSQC
jgi:hypothetical protein